MLNEKELMYLTFIITVRYNTCLRAFVQPSSEASTSVRQRTDSGTKM